MASSPMAAPSELRWQESFFAGFRDDADFRNQADRAIMAGLSEALVPFSGSGWSDQSGSVRFPTSEGLTGA